MDFKSRALIEYDIITQYWQYHVAIETTVLVSRDCQALK